MEVSSAEHPEAVLDGTRAPAAASNRPQRLIRNHHRDRDFSLRRALLLADVTALWLAMAIALGLATHRDAPLRDLLWILPTLPAWALLLRAYGLYRRPLRRFEPSYLDDASALFHALLVGTVGVWLFYAVAPVAPLSPWTALVFGLAALLAVALARIVVRRINLGVRGPERVFAVAPPEDVRVLARKLDNHPEYEMRLVGAVAGAGPAGHAEPEHELSAAVGEIGSVINSGEIDHLVVQLNELYVSQTDLLALMRACHRRNVRLSACPKVKTLLLPGVELNHIEGTGLLTYHPPVLSRSSRLLKRSMDVAFSALALALLAPLMALVTIAIRLDSPGPALFWQTRVGKDGRRFRLVKFRTMVPDAERMTAELMELSSDPDWLALEEDPRKTRLGQLLRQTSLDEVPQLWNVLRGEMSLVGPRPLPECDDESVRGWERHRLDLKPGLTGHWQVIGRNTIPFREMVEIDYAYVAGWSLWQDAKLLLRTVPVVLSNRGAS